MICSKKSVTLKPVTGVRTPLHSTIPQIISAYRAGQWSIAHVIQQHLNRIKDFQSSNAIIEYWPDDSLRIAKQKDEMLKSEGEKIFDHYPLFGIPFSIKGTFAYKGHTWNSGLVHRKDLKADQTATVVQRAIDAGAIPVCLSNIPESVTWIETYNRIYGRTLHPLDSSRTPGGSSGGEAVVLATGGAVFGIGTDLGGSIRIPAAFCGISGHKPSPGWIPGSGQYPEPFGKLWNYCVTGPMTRYASDLPILISILSGPDGYDPSIAEKKVLSQKPGNPLKDLQFFFLDEIPGISVSTKIYETQDWVKTKIKSSGGRTQRIDSSLFNHATSIWFSLLAENSHRGPSFQKILGGKNPILIEKEWLNFTIGKSNHTFPCLVLATLERLSSLQSEKKNRSLFEEAQSIRRELNRILGTNGVLICPNYPTYAPKHHYPKLRPFAWIYSGIFNALELPATSFPVMYCEKSGLPLSVQAVAGSNQDHLTLCVANALDAGPRIPRTK